MFLQFDIRGKTLYFLCVGLGRVKNGRRVSHFALKGRDGDCGTLSFLNETVIDHGSRHSCGVFTESRRWEGSFYCHCSYWSGPGSPLKIEVGIRTQGIPTQEFG